jgi:polyisoprenoid-binding protein YceI
MSLWLRVAGPISVLVAVQLASAQVSELQLDPGRTTVKFTLSDVLHTVHGTFRLQRGDLQFDFASGKVSGVIMVDARSGVSGNSMRDRKMHRDVLESERYREIVFRPDRVEGTVSPMGDSPVRVHGTFSIHGVDREIEVPADVDMAADHWSATVLFTIPYQKWGMKNPSTLFLRVDDSVKIEVVATGKINRDGATASSAR